MTTLLNWLKLPWALAKLWWYSVKIAWLLAKEQDEAVRKALEGRRLTDPGPEINKALLKDAANLRLKQ